jgi:hypothetical protein
MQGALNESGIGAEARGVSSGRHRPPPVDELLELALVALAERQRQANYAARRH